MAKKKADFENLYLIPKTTYEEIMTDPRLRQKMHVQNLNNKINENKNDEHFAENYELPAQGFQESKKENAQENKENVPPSAAQSPAGQEFIPKKKEAKEAQQERRSSTAEFHEPINEFPNKGEQRGGEVQLPLEVERILEEEKKQNFETKNINKKGGGFKAVRRGKTGKRYSCDCPWGCKKDVPRTQEEQQDDDFITDLVTLGGKI